MAWLRELEGACTEAQKPWVESSRQIRFSLGMDMDSVREWERGYGQRS